MNIQDLYKKFQIPPNLQRHMLEVASVADVICENWSGLEIDHNLILQGCLVHDLGNIVKFKRPFLGELEQNAEYWEKTQDDFIKKYGLDTFMATKKMMEEAGITEKVCYLIKEMKELQTIEKNFSWEARILEYADCCVMPEGIVRFKKRIEDLQTRYPDTDSNVWETMKKNAKIVEPFISIDLNSISSQEWMLRTNNMKDSKIEVNLS